MGCGDSKPATGPTGQKKAVVTAEKTLQESKPIEEKKENAPPPAKHEEKKDEKKEEKAKKAEKKKEDKKKKDDDDAADADADGKSVSARHRMTVSKIVASTHKKMAKAHMQSRNVRPFISSTFRDFNHERSMMTKRAFPELEHMCKERNVFFSPVDLRWGITAEQSADGRVIELCLGEVDRSRPYFVGLLGNRYGWHIPPGGEDKLLTETFDKGSKLFPWVNDHRDKSVTELEVLHGALNAPKEHHHNIFFYFRTQPNAADGEDPAVYESESEHAGARLAELKMSIRNAGLNTREYDGNTDMLYELMITDLKGAIDRDYPSTAGLSDLLRERMEMEAFAQTRARVYVGGEEYFKRMDEHVDSDDGPLVILGESGSGKSSLMANYAMRHEADNDHLVVAHYIGSTPASSYHYSLLRRVCAEVREYGQIDEPIPNNLEDLPMKMILWMKKLRAQNKKMVLILDAVNQLENRNSAHELIWLPTEFPTNVRVIISTLPGRCLDVMAARGWTTYKVHGLQDSQKREIIMTYLSLFSKTLNENQLNVITAAPQTSNPLYLRTVLNELRIFGSFERLDSAIQGYLAAEGPAELYEKVLLRWEQDYGANLVRDLMAFIWVSAQGLSDQEIMAITGLGRTELSPVLLAAEDVMVVRTGLMGFFHDHLRHAVQRRYLTKESVLRSYREKLSQYFLGKPEAEWTSPRAVMELPFQLEELQDWDNMLRILGRIDMFHALFVPDRRVDLYRYWRGIGNSKVKSTYEDALTAFEKENPAKREELLSEMIAIGEFLHSIGEYQDSCALYKRGVALGEDLWGSSDIKLASVLVHYCEALGKFGAVRSPTLKRAIDIIEKHPDYGVNSPDLVYPLIEMAIIESGRDTPKAHEIIDRAHKIASSSEKFQQEEAEHYCNTIRTKARVYWKEKRWVPAIKYYRQALSEAQMRLGPSHEFTSSCTNALGLCLQKNGDLEEAEECYRRVLEMGEIQLGKDHPTMAYRKTNYGSLQLDLGKNEAALETFKEALAIVERVFGPAHNQTKLVLRWVKTALKALGRTDDIVEIEARLAKNQDIVPTNLKL